MALIAVRAAGTLREYHATHNTPCPQSPVAPSALMHEPQRREPAVDDADTIHRRIQELRAEREVALNTIEEHTG